MIFARDIFWRIKILLTSNAIMNTKLLKGDVLDLHPSLNEKMGK